MIAQPNSLLANAPRIRVERFRVLDLFCGEGGAAEGIRRALPNADITGIDTVDYSKSYLFRFVQADALSYDLSGYDFIWASPPCQRYSRATNNRKKQDYPDFIPLVRERLQTTSAFWCIENVPLSPLSPTVILCGSQFNLRIWRHRLFETNYPIPPAGKCNHNYKPICPAGHKPDSFLWRSAMGIENYAMSLRGIAQSVPPAYSEYVTRWIPWNG